MPDAEAAGLICRAVLLSVKPDSASEKFHGRASFMRRKAFSISAVTLLPTVSVVNWPTSRCFTVPLRSLEADLSALCFYVGSRDHLMLSHWGDVMHKPGMAVGASKHVKTFCGQDMHTHKA